MVSAEKNDAKMSLASIVDQAKSSGCTRSSRAAMSPPDRPQSAFPKA